MASPWLATDLVKTVLSVIELAYALRTARQAKRAPNRRLAAGASGAALLFVAFFIGARDPWYLGWQFYLVFATLLFGSVLCLCLYTTVLVLGAAYASLKLRRRPPAFTTPLLISGAVTIIILMIIGVIGVFVTQQRSWASSRSFAACITAAFMGVVCAYGFYKLSFLVQEASLLRSESPRSGSPRRSGINENAKSQEYANHRAQESETAKPTLNPAKLGDSKSSLQKMWGKQRRGMPSPAKKEQENSVSTSQYHENENDAVQEVASPPEGCLSSAKMFSKKDDKIDLVGGSKSMMRNRVTRVVALNTRRQKDTTERVLFKLRAMWLASLIFFPAIFVAYLYLGVAQASSSGSYPERIAWEQENYSPIDDISGYFGLFINGFICFYSGY